MKYIFIIATEHQLFQVEEAIRHFNVNKADTVLIIFEVIDTAFIPKVQASNSFGQVFSFKNWTIRDVFFDRKKIKNFINFCQHLKNQLDAYVFFTSHYDSDPDLLFLHIVQPIKYYLMDEGTASFSVNYQRLNNIKNTFNYIIKSLLYQKKIYLPKQLTYFSQYNLSLKKGDSVEKYSVQVQDNPLVKLIENEMIFIGSSMVEVGIIEESLYLFLLEKIAQKFNHKTIYYNAHRKESKQKLLKIENLGFIVREQLEPFEKMFSQLQECPHLIASFYISGVLDNIAKRNKHIPELILYKFDSNLIKDVDIYDTIYEDIRHNKRLKSVEI